MRQGSLIESQSGHTWYVARCLEGGAQIVKQKKGVIGMLLCPSCESEADLAPTFCGNKIVSYQCHCGHEFADAEALVLTFGKCK